MNLRRELSSPFRCNSIQTGKQSFVNQSAPLREILLLAPETMVCIYNAAPGIKITYCIDYPELFASFAYFAVKSFAPF